jgi:hypothetical protein
MYQLDQLFKPVSFEFEQEVLIEDLAWERDVYLNALVDALVDKTHAYLESKKCE